MHRNAAKLTFGGRPGSWLGVNFWSRTGGPLMWRNYDSADVRDELRVLREHGLTMTRSFFYWPDFMPEPDRIDPEMTARFADFLDRHAEAGMTTVPTFLVGHMSGENWDPAWRGGRDLYCRRVDGRPPGLVRRGDGAPVRRARGRLRLARVQRDADLRRRGAAARRSRPGRRSSSTRVRAAGGTQPVSLGDGAWGIEVTGHDSGFSVADSARQCDFLGPHVYPVGDRPGPPALRRRLGMRAGRDVRLAGHPRGIRGQLRLRLRRPAPPTTTGRCCTTPCWPAPPAGWPGTTPTTTTWPTRTLIATTPSRCTSA